MKFPRHEKKRVCRVLALIIAVGVAIGAGSPLAADRSVLGELFSADN